MEIINIKKVMWFALVLMRGDLRGIWVDDYREIIWIILNIIKQVRFVMN